MQQTQARTQQKRSAPPPRPNAILLALALALAVYVLFYLVANVLLDDWTTRKLEHGMSQAMGRNVKLGDVNWSIGLDGVAVHTNRINIFDRDGKPFLFASKTRIAVALYPLLERKVIVKDVDMWHPTFWAKKLTPSLWNFSDLPQRDELQHINHLVVHDGTVHLRDISVPQRAAYETIINQVKGTIERPFGDRWWKFNLAFVVPHSGYSSAFSVSGTGDGPLKEWLNNKYSFTLSAANINPADFISVSDRLAYVKGPLNLELSADGVPAQQFKGKVHLKTPDFVFAADQVEISAVQLATIGDASQKEKASLSARASVTNGSLTFPGAKFMPHHFSGKVVCGNGMLILDNIAGKLGAGTFRTSGKVLPGKSIALAYSGTAIDMEATREALRVLKIRPPAIMRQPLFGLVKQANMTIKGDYRHPEVVVVAVPQQLYCQPFGKGRTFELTEGGSLTITSTSLTLNTVAGKVGKGTFKLDGKTGLLPGMPIDITFSGKNVDVGAVKLALQELAVNTSFFNPAVAGSIEGAVGSIRGTVKNPTVMLSLVPRGVLYQPLGTQRMIELVGGRVDIIGPVLRFDHVHGLLGRGAFTLNGIAGLGRNHKIDVDFRARNLDLSHVKVALLELNVHSPLLAEQLLFGRVHDVKLTVKGVYENPVIDMACLPYDVRYEPLGSTRAVVLSSGTITYRHDILTLNKVHARSPRSKMTLSFAIANLSLPRSELKSLAIDTAGFDITDLHSYLAAPRTPPAVREHYKALLHKFQIDPERGKLRGHLQFTAGAAAGQYSYDGDVVLDHIAVLAAGMPLHDLTGHLRTQGNQMVLDKLSGALGTSTFQANGFLNDYNDPQHLTMDLGVEAAIQPDNLIHLIYRQTPPFKIVTNKPVMLQAHISEAGHEHQAKFTATVDPNSEFEIEGQFGDLLKPPAEPITVAGQINFHPGFFSITDTQITAGQTVIALSGTYQEQPQGEPQIDFKLDIPNFVSAASVLSFIEINEQPLSNHKVGGKLRGRVELRGSINKPAVRGWVELNNVSIPDYKIVNASGRMKAIDWLTTASTQPAKVEFSTLQISNLTLHNVRGNAAANASGDGLVLKNLSTDIARGTITLDGTIRREYGADLNFKLQKVDANELLTEVFHAPSEVTGTVNGGGNIHIDLRAADPIKGTSGMGTFTVTDGKVTRFTALEKGINALNLIKGGPLEFNLNNLLSTVAPSQSGKFKTLSATVKLAQGQLEIHHMRYNGVDLYLRGHGAIDLVSKKIQMKIAGTIPRVSQRGPLGFLAPFLSIHGLADTVEDIPERLANKHVPSNAPRAFSFMVEGRLDQPQAISQSIQKTFQWLPNLPKATPHPAFAIDSGSVPM